MTPSLDELFTIIDTTMKDQILTGDDFEGHWELRRFEVQIEAFSSEWKYAALIKDWARVGTDYVPGNELSFGYADTPNQALYDAMKQFDLIPEESSVGRD